MKKIVLTLVVLVNILCVCSCKSKKDYLILNELIEYRFEKGFKGNLILNYFPTNDAYGETNCIFAGTEILSKLYKIYYSFDLGNNFIHYKENYYNLNKDILKKDSYILIIPFRAYTEDGKYSNTFELKFFIPSYRDLISDLLRDEFKKNNIIGSNEIWENGHNSSGDWSLRYNNKQLVKTPSYHYECYYECYSINFNSKIVTYTHRFYRTTLEGDVYASNTKEYTYNFNTMTGDLSEKVVSVFLNLFKKYDDSDMLSNCK